LCTLPPGAGTGADPYYTCTRLSDEVGQEVAWWKDFLVLSEGKIDRLHNAATLVPTFGDGVAREQEGHLNYLTMSNYKCGKGNGNHQSTTSPLSGTD
jgi:hypothetical protein